MAFRVVHHDCLPTRSSFTTLAVIWLFLDHFYAPEWVMVGYWLLVVFDLVTWLISIMTETPIQLKGYGKQDD